MSEKVFERITCHILATPHTKTWSQECYSRRPHQVAHLIQAAHEGVEGVRRGSRVFARFECVVVGGGAVAHTHGFRLTDAGDGLVLQHGRNDIRLNLLFKGPDEALINPHSQIRQHLPILGEVKVSKTLGAKERGGERRSDMKSSQRSRTSNIHEK